MSQQNVDLVRAIYEALATGDGPGVISRMCAGIVWNEAENFPYADRNPYRGPEAILAGWAERGWLVMGDGKNRTKQLRIGGTTRRRSTRRPHG